MKQGTLLYTDKSMFEDKFALVLQDNDGNRIHLDLDQDSALAVMSQIAEWVRGRLSRR